VRQDGERLERRRLGVAAEKTPDARRARAQLVELLQHLLLLVPPRHALRAQREARLLLLLQRNLQARDLFAHALELGVARRARAHGAERFT